LERHTGSRTRTATVIMAFLVTFTLFATAIIAVPMMMEGEAGPTEQSKANNVIMMVPDGTSSTHTTLARWYKNAPLALDEMPVGLVRTYGGQSIITDSAPAATAFATGYKTSDKYIGVLPGPVTIPGVSEPSSEDQYKPVASILEAANLQGMSVGIVCTSTVQHATPAGFSAHWTDRNNYNEIAEQQVYEDIDVMFGGGSDYLIPESEGGKRTDGEDLTEVLVSRGYSYITTRGELLDLTSSVSKVWGLFASNAMAHDMDRELHPEEPSLAEMTEAAIEILSKNPKGFFLLVEGSQVDWSSHANDPVGVISETLAFDDAVQVSLDFAKTDGKTLVMAFTDHGNGGMTIGNWASNSTYSKMPLSAVIDPLKNATMTGYALMELLRNDVTADNVRSNVSAHYGLDLNDDEVANIMSAYNATSGEWDVDTDYLLGPIMSERSFIGWTTSGHTGEDVTLYAYGPGAPSGLLDNTELPHVAAKAMGVDLELTNKALYVEAETTFACMGLGTGIDSADPQNLELVVTCKGKEVARLTLSTDILEVCGKTCELSGLVVYSEKSGKAYVPQDAIQLLKKLCR